jgi:hypothetical protein
MTAHYPSPPIMHVEHSEPLPILDVLRSYAGILETCGFGPGTRYAVPNMKGTRPGDLATLESELRRFGPDPHAFRLCTSDGTVLVGARDDDEHSWAIRMRAQEDNEETWRKWLAQGLDIVRAAVRLPAFSRALLPRDSGATAFLPMPPIAHENYIATARDQRVAECYDDPAVFWRAWKSVERIGDVALCSRALEDLETEDWLEAVHWQQMALARAAKPNLTTYRPPHWLEWTRPWWEPGDPQDEQAGLPALTAVGYDPATKTFEYAGYISPPVQPDLGEEPRHVLIYEVHEIRALVLAKRTASGQPVETVRVVFADEWMARQERRPLLDVGAGVYYQDHETGNLVSVAD